MVLLVLRRAAEEMMAEKAEASTTKRRMATSQTRLIISIQKIRSMVNYKVEYSTM